MGNYNVYLPSYSVGAGCYKEIPNVARRLGKKAVVIGGRTAIEKAKECKGMPTVVICKTVKGKGVSFMENEAAWHGTAPSKEQCEKALAEIGGDR